MSFPADGRPRATIFTPAVPCGTTYLTNGLVNSNLEVPMRRSHRLVLVVLALTTGGCQSLRVQEGDSRRTKVAKLATCAAIGGATKVALGSAVNLLR
jgi:hypothetical protein